MDTELSGEFLIPCKIIIPQLDRAGVFVAIDKDYMVSGLTTRGGSILVPYTKLNAAQLAYIADGLRAQLFELAGVADPQATKDTHET